MSNVDLMINNTVIEMIIHVFMRQNPSFTITNSEIEWNALSQEGALLVRVYCEYCSLGMDEDRIEKLIPTLSDWVALMESCKLALCDAETDDDRIVLEYVLQQMFKTIKVLVV